MTCRWCAGDCDGADLHSLLGPELSWIWEQLGPISDRRSDIHLVDGTVTLTGPTDPGQRAASTGLVPGRFGAGQTRRINLADLTRALQRIDPRLTPGVVTAHALKRRLAPRAAEKLARAQSEADLIPYLAPISDDDSTIQTAWAALRRTGRVTQLIADPDASSTLRHVADFVVALQTRAPEDTIDRRVLAHNVTGNPHALDDGEPIAAMVIAVLASLGLVEQNTRTRTTWAQIGVHFDGITGGLSMLGIAPIGWTIPPGAPITVPPRVLAGCAWPGPGPDATRRLFVTENPSVLTACLDNPAGRMICTSGKPSALVIDTLASLATAGWQLRVRADFDDTGITSVNTILDQCSNATAWRMNAADYLQAASGGSTVRLRVSLLPEASWDPQLKAEMVTNGFAAFEEAALERLVDDVATSDEGDPTAAADTV